MYRLLRPLLFSADAEAVHRKTIDLLAVASRSRPALRALSAAFAIGDSRLAVKRFGLSFPNPVGLAAGMDKEGRALPAWQALGFGFSEVGSVTALPQPGNPQPRLFRLPDDRAVINRMGFNNEGAEALTTRLRALRERNALQAPLLVNVGKSRTTPLGRAAEDYRESLQLVWPYADAVVINVSSPNTPGLRSLQEPEALSRLLAICDDLQGRGRSSDSPPLPVLLKLAPDLDDRELERLASLASDHRVSGLVAVNTTVDRRALVRPSDEAGGLSGRPLAPRSLEVLRLLVSCTELPVVSVGGIFSASDVIERLRSGASLVELYTGFVYGGPSTVRAILQGVLRHLEAEGVPDVESLIGIDS